ncbi:MAG: PDZ domain-containing protein, partial [Gemmatimonadetes bacterium]|nr:PDZ domain-containing protein [Gemmatimonadota bacterium]
PRGSTRVVFEGIRRRMTPLPVGLDVDAQRISPDGKTLLVTATVANQQNLYVYPLDELSREPAVAKQVTSTPGSKRDAQFSPDGKEVWYLDQGRIAVVPVAGGQARGVQVSAEMDVDFAREKMAVFREGWTYLRDHFHDPRMNGVDWEAARATYEPRVAGARTPEEMRRVMSLMVGELNASHLGVSGPGGGAPTTGRLGVRFDRAEYERSGRLRVTETVPLGPAALAGVVPGDVLVAVEGTRVDAHTNLDALLENRIGRRVALTVVSGEGGRTREVAVRPVTQGTEKGLLYRAWVEANRDYVSRVSGGRLGYVHMFDMGSASLSQLYLDLDAENHGRDGVVIDVRNNNGGFVNPYALDVFARRPYLTMTTRGLPPVAARTNLGQRALESPTILVTNQHSLSDAEDFTEGYRSLGLGKTVGEPTAGWIIFTWNLPLVDGTILRVPRTTITGSRGENLEMSPRPVDVAVTRPIGESLAGRDSQLDAAVRELLRQIDAGRGSRSTAAGAN